MFSTLEGLSMIKQFSVWGYLSDLYSTFHFRAACWIFSLTRSVVPVKQHFLDLCLSLWLRDQGHCIIPHSLTPSVNKLYWFFSDNILYFPHTHWHIHILVGHAMFACWLVSLALDSTCLIHPTLWCHRNNSKLYIQLVIQGTAELSTTFTSKVIV